jgi:DDE family transposase
MEGAMRRDQYTLSYTDVWGFAVQSLVQALNYLPQPTSVSAELLVQLLVRAAAELRSLWAVCLDAALRPGVETVRLSLWSWLPATTEQLLPGLVTALHQRLPKSLKRRPRTMAIDLHLKPYYGNRATPGTIRGQRKASTKTFFAYATLLLIREGQTYTVGLTPVSPKQPQTEILAVLLAQAARAGLRPKVLLLDRGFYAATTFQWLQAQRIAFVMPMIRRGKAGRRKADGTGTQQFFVRGRRGWDQYTWLARPRRDGRQQTRVEMTIQVCMTPNPRRRKRTPKRRAKSNRPLVYACWGIQRQPVEIRKLYRQRFRIETSYRQMREGLAKTCSRSVVFRLLLIGIALVLRNLWVWLHAEHLACIARHGRRRCLCKLRLRTMLRWIAHALTDLLGQQLSVALTTPLLAA